MSEAAKSTSRSIYLETTSAQNEMKKLVAESTKLKTILDSGELSGDKLNKTLAKFDAVNTKIKSVQDQFDKGLQPSLKQQQSLVQQLNNELSRMSQSNPQFAEKTKIYQEQNAVLAEMKSKVTGVEVATEEMGGAFGHVFTRIAEGFASFFVIEKIIDLVKEFTIGAVEEFDQAEEATIGLRNALENAGRPELYERLRGIGDVFAQVFQRLDNDDITNVVTKLVNYGKLTESQIKQTTGTIIEFAAKQRISLTDAAEQIIKGFEGQGKALKTFGVNVKDATSFTERYNIINGELYNKIKGTEAALEQTNKGAWERFKQGFRDLQESIGGVLQGLTGLEEKQVQTAISSKQEADQAQALVDRYEELSKKVNKTAAEKDELKKITNTLVGTFGTSIVQINKETGALELNLAATKDLIKQKLLLANGKAAEIAAKYYKAVEDESGAIDKQKELYKLLGEARKNAGGLSASEVENKAINQNIKSDQFGALDESKLTPEEKTLFNLNNQLNTFIVTKRRASSEITDLGKQLEELGFKGEDVKKMFQAPTDGGIVGKGDPNELTAAQKKAAEKAAEQAEKLQEKLFQQYNEFVRGLNASITEIVAPDASKKFVAIFKETADELEKLKKLATDDDQYQKGKLLILEKQKDAIHALLTEEAKTYKAAPEQVSTVDPRTIPAALRNSLPKGPVKVPIEIIPEIAPEDQKAVAAGLAKVLDRLKRDASAGLKLDVLNAQNPTDRKNAQLKELDEEHDAEMQNKDLTDNEKLVKEKEYQQKRQQIAFDYEQQIIGFIQQGLEFAAQAVDVLGKFAQAQTNKENAQLKNELKNNDTKKTALKKQLDSKLISQQQYNQQVAALDNAADVKKAELEKKQQERAKKIAIAQAIINGAMAVTSTLAAIPGPIDILSLGTFRAIQIALAIATTAAEVAVIAKQQYAGGGKVDHPGNGRINVNSNIPTQPNGDDVLATVKRGEVILNEEQQNRLGGANTFRSIGVPGFAGGGPVLKPFWQTRPYRSIDTNRVTNSMQVLKFATGGLVASGTVDAGQQATVPQTDPALLAAFERQEAINLAVMNTLQNLNGQLSNGITTNFSLKKYDEARALESRITKDAQFR